LKSSETSALPLRVYVCCNISSPMAHRASYAGEIRQGGLCSTGNGGLYACPKVVGWCGAVCVYERNWNSGFCWQSHFDENLLWQPTGSCKSLSKPSTAFHYTCPALINCRINAGPCQSAIKIIFGVIYRVKSCLIWGLARSCAL
jgi:hypothetical protein